MANRLSRLRSNWWLPIIGIYASARIVSAILLLIMASIQEENYWTAAQPGYFDFLNIWDVEWYHKIYSNGYPVILPHNNDGSVGQNSWAFYPAFPFLVRALNFVTTIDWVYLAPIVATVIGFFFILMVYRLLLLRQNEKVARWAVVLISFSMASPILQIGYAESMSLFLFAAALYCYLTEKWWRLAAALVLLSVTRPGLIAFVLFFLGMFVYHFYKSRRLRVIDIGFAALSGLLGVAWIGIAWLVTGIPDAYIKTELAWRAGITGSSHLVPFSPWFVAARFDIGPWGDLLIAALMVFMALAMYFPSVRALGGELRIWVGAYMLYLFAVFFPQSSTPRILFPAFPLLAAIAIASSSFGRLGKGLILAATIIGQVGWLLICWKYTAPDYTPP